MKELELREDAQRVERFQALSAGQYWRALKEIPEQGIDLGSVLLIQSIRWVDEAPHTIILRPHPNNIGQSRRVETLRSDGTTWTHWVEYREHRFLLTEFLELFQFEPDHQQVRTQEIRQIQQTITDLQTQLIEGQSNPQRLALIVEEGLRQQAQPEDVEDGETPAPTPGTALAVPDSNLVALATGSVINAIGAGLDERGIAQMKAAAQHQHQVATIKAKWIQAKTTEIAQTIQAMTPYYQEQAAAALAQTEDVRSYVHKLMQGIDSLDLYVGKGVEVRTIRKGPSAPADEPLTFMQRKLMMDEEFAVWADVDDTFDFSRESEFFDALTQHDSLVDQIFPTPRCITVMAATRRYVDYGDKLANATRNQENKKVFLLVRDGQNIHQVWSPVESHLGANRLFPSRDEQDQIFRGFDGREIKFDDIAFTDKLAAHEEHALHYKRFLLLACGLDHRLNLFGEFYPGPKTLSFVSLEFQEQHCRFLHDDPEANALLGEARPSVQAWIAHKNTYLRSGSRVLCNWRELMNPTTAPAACKRDGRGNIDRQYHAVHDMEIVIPRREGTSLCVTAQVSGTLRRNYTERQFGCKVDLTKLKSGEWDYIDLPYLCLDAVDPRDLQWYIHHRESRRDHLSYIRFFKKALKFLTAERASEQASREALRVALEQGRIAQGSQAQELIDQAVIAWRAAHRGQSLPPVPAQGKDTEWTSLLDQLFVLARNGQTLVQDVEAFVAAKGLSPLRLVLDGSARLIIYTSPLPQERDDRLAPHAWVHCLTLERGARGGLKERARRWAMLPKQAASETTLHEWPLASEWVFESNLFSSYERKQAMLVRTFEWTQTLETHLDSSNSEAHAARFAQWRELRAAGNAHSRYVFNPRLAIPIGLIYYPRAKQLRYLCVGLHHAHVLLHHTAQTAESRQELRARFARTYNSRASAERQFDEAVAEGPDWALMEIDAATTLEAGSYLPPQAEGQRLAGKAPCDPRLSSWLVAWQDSVNEYAQVWLAPGVLDQAGRCRLDDILKIELPPDFNPVKVTEINLHPSSRDKSRYTHWFDIAPLEDRAAPTRQSRADLYFHRHRPAGITEGMGYSSSEETEANLSAALQALRDRYSDPSTRLVRDRELPDAPQGAAGTERWFVITE